MRDCFTVLLFNCISVLKQNAVNKKIFRECRTEIRTLIGQAMSAVVTTDMIGVVTAVVTAVHHAYRACHMGFHFDDPARLQFSIFFLVSLYEKL